MQQASSPQLDKGAQQLLDRMIAAHQALFALSVQVKTEAVAERRRETATASVSYQKPGKVRVELKRGDGTSELLICDGINRQLQRPQTRRKTKAEAGEKALVATLTQANFFLAPVFLYLSSRAAPVRSLLPGVPKVLGFGNPTQVEQVPVELVIADIESEQGRARLQFYIGKEDFLLRRLVIQAEQADGGLTLTETYMALKTNPSFEKKTFQLTF